MHVDIMSMINLL